MKTNEEKIIVAHEEAEARKEAIRRAEARTAEAREARAEAGRKLDIVTAEAREARTAERKAKERYAILPNAVTDRKLSEAREARAEAEARTAEARKEWEARTAEETEARKTERELKTVEAREEAEARTAEAEAKKEARKELERKARKEWEAREDEAEARREARKAEREARKAMEFSPEDLERIEREIDRYFGIGSPEAIREIRSTVTEAEVLEAFIRADDEARAEARVEKAEAEARKDFIENMWDYVNDVRNGNDCSESLSLLSRAVVASVLRKMYNGSRNATAEDGETAERKEREARKGLKVNPGHTVPNGGNATMKKIRSDVYSDIDILSRTAYNAENARETVVDSKGRYVSVTLSESEREAEYKIMSEALGEGMDLVQTASVALLEETEKAKTDGRIYAEGYENDNFLETVYVRKALRTRVKIQNAETVWKWEETCGIREAFRAVRKAVQNSRAFQVASLRYTYLNETLTDDRTGTAFTLYERLPLYSTFNGESVRPSARPLYVRNGSETAELIPGGTPSAVVADISPEAFREVKEIVERLNLSRMEAIVLKYRLSGNGVKAIATALGCKDGTVKSHMKRIKAKAEAIGLNGENWTAEAEARKESGREFREAVTAYTEARTAEARAEIYKATAEAEARTAEAETEVEVFVKVSRESQYYDYRMFRKW